MNFVGISEAQTRITHNPKIIRNNPQITRDAHRKSRFSHGMASVRWNLSNNISQHCQIQIAACDGFAEGKQHDLTWVCGPKTGMNDFTRQNVRGLHPEDAQ